MLTFRRKKKRSNIEPVFALSALTLGLMVACYNEAQKSPTSLPVTSLPTPVPTITSTAPPPKVEKVSRGEERKNKIIEAINRNLAGNLGEFFYTSGKTYAVNPMMMAAICRHETANWTSNLAVKHNNPGGINWSNRWVGKYSKTGRYVSFPDKQTGINEYARLLKDVYIDAGHKSLDLIKLKYAPNSDRENGKYGMSNEIWLPNVERIYHQILKEVEE